MPGGYFCKKCGYHAPVDKHEIGEIRRKEEQVICPNCDIPMKLEHLTKEEIKRFLKDPYAEHF